MSSFKTPSFIIDSHVHFWEKDALPTLAWCKPGDRLGRVSSLDDYVKTVNTPADEDEGDDGAYIGPRSGYIFVETDRKNSDGEDWTYPLEEVAYMRRLVEAEAEGTSGTKQVRCMALVPWAPVHKGPEVLEKYLDAVKEAAGPVAWPLVRGFRYLVQDKPHGTMVADAFVDAVRLLGRRGFVFDLGIDQHRRGRTQMLEARTLVERVHTVPGSLDTSLGGTPLPDAEKVVLVINHMARPNLHVLNPQADRGFAVWRNTMFTLGRASPSHVFVKFSGLFSEMPKSMRDQSPQAFFGASYPWLAVLLAAFGPSRLMFGTDWPVCTANFADDAVPTTDKSKDDDDGADKTGETGADKERETGTVVRDECKPLNHGEASAWDKWRRITAYTCYMASLDDDDASMLWGGTAVKAYGLEKK